MDKHHKQPARGLEKAATPFDLKPLALAVRKCVRYSGLRGAKGAKGAKHADFDRNTITSTSCRNDDSLISEDIAATSLNPHHDTDEDYMHGDIGPLGVDMLDAGVSDFDDPDSSMEQHRCHASHDLMANTAANLLHIAECIMVDTLDLEIPGIQDVDETELKKTYGEFDDDAQLKGDTEWRKGSLSSPTGKRSLRVRFVKMKKLLQISGSNGVNTRAHNVVSSGDVTMHSYWMCRDVHKTLKLDLPVRVGYELVHGRLAKVTRIDVVLLLKLQDGITKAQLINALAIAGIYAGVNSSLYVNESVYFDQNSQKESSKMYDKAAELKRARKGGLPDLEGVELLIDLNETTIRLEVVFRTKRLAQVAKKLGKEQVPATFTKEVLAQMVLDLLSKHVCHGQIFRRLDTKELHEIPLPYRSTVAHWQNGMHLPDMVISERVLREHARYLKKLPRPIDIDAPPPDSVIEPMSLVDVLVPKNFMPVPAEIRSNPALFFEADMVKHREMLQKQMDGLEGA